MINLMETGSKQWDEEVLNDMFNKHDVKLIKNIPIPALNQKDLWTWRNQEGSLLKDAIE